MKEEQEKQPNPLPIEPGHVMSREKYQQLTEQQKQK